MVAAREAPRLIQEWLDWLPSSVEADARLVGERWVTMRFANSRVHQPLSEEDVGLSLRVWEDGRLGCATTNVLTRSGVEQTIRRARALAKAAPVDKRFAGFPPAQRRTSPTKYSASTAAANPTVAGRFARAILEEAATSRAGSRTSGVVNVGGFWLAVANTQGIHRSTRSSVAQADVLVEDFSQDPPMSGWAESASWDMRNLDARALGREAASRVASSSPRSVPAGDYRVVLTAPAAGELLWWLGYLGFGGHAEEEKWSALEPLRGHQIAPRALTVVDDGTSSQSLPQAVDFEGVTKRPFPLIDHGVVGDAVMDLVTAAHLGRTPTGHGPPPESPWGDTGPLPNNIIVEPGTASFDELVRTVGTGLLVTRFHYVRVVHPRKSTITGMTRDGTYRIEKGEIGGPVRNLRFTESIVRALSGLEAVGSDVQCHANERGVYSVTTPSFALSSFRFTSATVF